MNEQHFLSPAELLVAMASTKKPRSALDLTNPMIKPQSALEISLAELWSDVLRITELGTNDHIFDLGGDSLHIIQIISRVRGIYDVELSIMDCFDNPTIASQAQLLKAALDGDEGRGEASTGM